MGRGLNSPVPHHLELLRSSPEMTKPVLSMKHCFTAVLLIAFLQASAQDLDFLPTAKGELIKHTYYTLSYIEAHEQPEWVAYYLSPDMLRAVHKRKDTFKPDPAVSTGSATYDDYGTSPEYDAGHLLPCRQMQFDCTAMSETFYMSNMSPQHKDFNRHKWSYLEKLERNIAWRNGGLYVITGPVLTSTRGTIGLTNRISIPNYYYKVFLSHSEAGIKAIAFLLPNEKTSVPFEDYVVSIDSLEALSGIDFFPALDDALEDRIEAFSDKTKWSFKNPNNKFGYNLPGQPCPSERSRRININTASLDDLITLPGISASRAEAIIVSRPYGQVNDITKARGIGNARLKKLASLITVE